MPQKKIKSDGANHNTPRCADHPLRDGSLSAARAQRELRQRKSATKAERVSSSSAKEYDVILCGHVGVLTSFQQCQAVVPRIATEQAVIFLQCSIRSVVIAGIRERLGPFNYIAAIVVPDVVPEACALLDMEVDHELLLIYAGKNHLNPASPILSYYGTGCAGEVIDYLFPGAKQAEVLGEMVFPIP
jgi:hypothetical protein